MPLNYDPKDAALVLPAAQYQAIIEKVEDAYTKNTNKPMQKITYRVYGPNCEVLITDYIVVPETLWKLKVLAKALGHQKAFDTGTFQADDFINSNVIVELAIKEATDQYQECNVIKKVLPVATPQSTTQSQPARRPQPVNTSNAISPISNRNEFKEDDIPF